MFPGYMLQGGSSSLLQGGGSTGSSLQGSSANPQQTLSVGTLQPANVNPQDGGNYTLGGGGQVQGLVTTTPAIDPAVAAAQAAEAARQAKVRSLRGDVTNLANSIKDIFNQRYDLVDQSAGEQTGKLNSRFATESGDITNQVEGENQKLGAAHAAGGSFDSSYRANNQNTVTTIGQGQIRDLGTELEDNISKIAAWVATQKGQFDAQKSGMDSIVARLGETDDVGELTSLRSQLDSRIAELRGGQAEYNTNAQNKASLEGIAPSSQRTQQLKTTLSQIVAGNADPKMKTAIASQLIQSAGLSPEDAQTLLSGVTTDIQKQAETTA